MMVKSFVFSTRNTAIIFPPVRKKGRESEDPRPWVSDSLFCSGPSDQQPVTVHRNGHAGHEGHIVLAVHNGQVGGIHWQHLLDLIHSVGEGFVIDVEIENVSVFQLWEVGEQPRIAHAGVPSQHAVGTFTAHWHAGCRQGRVNVRGFDKMNFLL